MTIPRFANVTGTASSIAHVTDPQLVDQGCMVVVLGQDRVRK